MSGRPVEDLRGCRDIVMAAVSSNGEALEHASDEQRGNFEVVMQAVSKNALALEFASDELKDNQAIVMKVRNEQKTALSIAGADHPLDLLKRGCANSGVCLERAGTSTFMSDIHHPNARTSMSKKQIRSEKNIRADFLFSRRRFQRMGSLFNMLHATSEVSMT